MHQEGHLHQKIINLCKFINNPDNDKLLNILIQKSRQLGLAISPFFSKQRYIYNFALAAINVIVDYQEGFELAAIFLKDICHGKSYWDILHFLDQLKEEVKQTLTKVDDVFEKVHVYNIAKSIDLNAIYQCHCSMNTLNQDHLQKKISNTNKKLQSIISRAQNAQRISQINLIDKAATLPNKNLREQKKIISTSTKFINLDAELIDLCQIQNKNNENQSQMPQLSELMLNQGEQFRIIIQQLSQKSSSIREIEYIDKMEGQNQEGKKKQKKIWQQNVKSLINLVNLESQFESVCSQSSQLQQCQVINVQKQNYIFNENLLYHLEDINKARNQEKQDFIIDFEFRKDNDILLLMDQPNGSNNYLNQQKFQLQKATEDKIHMSLIDKSEYLSGKNNNSNRNEQKSLERCQLCMQLYHPYCQNDQIFICNTCFLKQNSLNFRVIKNLFTGYVQSNSYLTLVTFLSPDVSTAKVQYSSSYIIEMRLQVIRNQKIQHQNSKQSQRINIDIERKKEDQKKKKKQKKFGKFMFYLNYQPIPVKNLSYGSEIISIKFPLKFLEQKNILIIEKLQNKNSEVKKNIEGVLQNSHLLLVGIYKVVPKSKRKELIKNSIVQIPVNSMKLFYRSLFEQKKENSFKISTLSYLTNKPMMFPIRSFQCKHPQCFDYSEIGSLIYPKKRTLIRKTKKNILNNIDGQNIQNKNMEKNKDVQQKIIKRAKNRIICPKCNVIIEGFYIDSLIKQSIQENMLKDKKDQCFYIQFRDQKFPENMIQVLQSSEKPGISAEMIDEKLDSDQEIIKPAILFDNSSSEDDSEYQTKKSKDSLKKSKKIWKKNKKIDIQSQKMKKLMKNKQNEAMNQILQIDQSSLIQIENQEQSSCQLFILSKEKLEKSRSQMQELEFYTDILRNDWESNKYEVLICEDSF